MGVSMLKTDFFRAVSVVLFLWLSMSCHSHELHSSGDEKQSGLTAGKGDNEGNGIVADSPGQFPSGDQPLTQGEGVTTTMAPESVIPTPLPEKGQEEPSTADQAKSDTDQIPLEKVKTNTANQIEQLDNLPCFPSEAPSLAKSSQQAPASNQEDAEGKQDQGKAKHTEESGKKVGEVSEKMGDKEKGTEEVAKVDIRQFDNKDKLPPLDEKQTTESAEVPKIPTTTPPPSKEAAPSPQTPVTGAPPTTTAETDTEDKDPLPAFDEWTQKMLAEKNKEVKNGKTVLPVLTNGQANKKLTNFAALGCGAKVLAHNPQLKNAMYVLSENKDEYMINPCSTKKWFTIELCEPAHVKYIEIANFELFSSLPETFKVYISERHPTKEWTLLGNFHAKDVRTLQGFSVNGEIYAKFVKVEMLTHYGQEHFCPLSILRVFGLNMHELEEDGTDDTDDVEDGNQDKDGPKNLFSHATDLVSNLVKSVLSGSEEAADGEKGNATVGTNVTNATEQPVPPCFPDERPQENREAELITKLSDDDQIPSVLPTVAFIPQGAPLFIWVQHCRQDSSSMQGLKHTLALCGYLTALNLAPSMSVTVVSSIVERYNDTSEDVASAAQTTANQKTVETGSPTVSISVISSSPESTASPSSSSKDESAQTLQSKETEKLTTAKSNLDASESSSAVLQSTGSSSHSSSTNSMQSSLPSVIIIPPSESGTMDTSIVVESSSVRSASILEPSSIPPTVDTQIPPPKIPKPPGHSVKPSQPDPVKLERELIQQDIKQLYGSESDSVKTVEASSQSDSPNSPNGKIEASILPSNSATDGSIAPSSTDESSMDNKGTSSINIEVSGQMEKTAVEQTIQASTVDGSTIKSEILKSVDIEPDVHHLEKDIYPENSTVSEEQGDGKTKEMVVPINIGSVPRRETAMMKLTNKVKALELNISLSSRYLEELSQRYRKKMEEMQKAINKTMTQLMEVTAKAAEREKKQDHTIQELTLHITKLTETVDKFSIEIKNSEARVVNYLLPLLAVEAFAIMVILLTCLLRRPYKPTAKELENIIQSSWKSKKLPERRRSVDGSVGHLTPIRRRHRSRSQDSLRVSGSDTDLTIVHPRPLLWKESPQKHTADLPKKKKRKKLGSKGLVPSQSTSAIPGKPCVSRASSASLNSAGLIFSGTNHTNNGKSAAKPASNTVGTNPKMASAIDHKKRQQTSKVLFKMGSQNCNKQATSLKVNGFHTHANNIPGDLKLSNGYPKKNILTAETLVADHKKTENRTNLSNSWYPWNR